MELVTFDIQKNRFALAASSISQVLEPLAVTPLPYAPPDVEGLVNVSGSVLLQLNLALRLGMSAGPANGSGNLVVVFTGHENIALQVDRVHNKINLDGSLITRYAATEPRNLVCGEFALNDGVVLLLDAQALDMRALDPRGVPESGGGLMGFDLNDATRDGALQKTDVQIATITVEECGEAYALEMSQVHEIVQMGPLTQLPGASFEVAGLMPLREEALLIVSLGALLRRPMIGQAHFVLVVNVQGIQLGISVSSIHGIERYARESIQGLEGAEGAQLEGYLKGTGARVGRITGLLSMRGLFSPQTLAQYQRFLPRKNTSMQADLQRASPATRRMLSFRLGTERCALPLLGVDRVEAYSPGVNLPDGDEFLAGVIQVKGEIAPVIDLRRLLGVTAIETSSYVIVRVENEAWALMVDRIERVIDLQEIDITPVRNQQNDYMNEVGKLDGELISLLSLMPLTVAAKSQLK